MTSYYNAVENIFEAARQQNYFHTFSEGDIFEVDLDKKGLYPLIHLTPLRTSWATENTAVYSFQISIAELVDTDTSYFNDNPEYGAQDNTRDVWSQTLRASDKLIKALRSYENSATGFRLVGIPSAENFKESYKNRLAGWTITIDVEVFNNVC